MHLLKKNTIHYDAIDCVQCTELPSFDKFIEVHLFKEPMEQKTKKKKYHRLFWGSKGE